MEYFLNTFHNFSIFIYCNIILLRHFIRPIICLHKLQTRRMKRKKYILRSYSFWKHRYLGRKPDEMTINTPIIDIVEYTILLSIVEIFKNLVQNVYFEFWMRMKRINLNNILLSFRLINISDIGIEKRIYIIIRFWLWEC